MEFDFCTDIVLIADDFYNAFKRCYVGKNSVQIGGTIKYSACNIPAIVNGTFALELYFKSMLPHKTCGHKIKILFDNLTEAMQDEIIEAITPQLDKLSWQKSFEEYLENMNKVFVYWRYISEKGYTVGYLGNRINEYLQVLEILLPIVKNITYRHK